MINQNTILTFAASHRGKTISIQADNADAALVDAQAQFQSISPRQRVAQSKITITSQDDVKTVLTHTTWTGLTVSELIDAGRLVTVADIAGVCNDIIPAASIDDLGKNKITCAAICEQFGIN